MDYNSSIRNSSIMSIGTESISLNNNQSGGFFGFGKDSNDNTINTILDAAKNRDYEKVHSMITNNSVSNFNNVDNNKCTLLHYLARDHDSNKLCNELTNTILSGGTTSFLNKQNNQGDTALHVAIKNENYDMASKLEDAGTDLSIRNNDGLKIDVETPTIDNINDNQMEGGASSVISNAINNFFMPAKQDEYTFTENKLLSDNFMSEYSNQTIDNINDNQMEGGASSMISDAINKFFMPAKQNEYTFTENKLLSDNFMSEYSAPNSTFNTDSFLNGIFGNTGQDGGAKKKKKVTKGKRPLTSNSRKRKKKKQSLTRSTELGRLINKQGKHIHEKVLEKIMTLMKLNKDKPEDVELARNYKAVLWSQVKKDKTLKTNLDKSVKLETLTTIVNLKKIKPKTGEKLREDSRKAKEQRIKEQAKNNKKPTDTLSDTSSDKESKGGGFSETSYSNF